MVRKVKGKKKPSDDKFVGENLNYNLTTFSKVGVICVISL